MSGKLIYLDYAAATPLGDDVRAAMEPFWSQQFYNPSATYLPARSVRVALDTARRQVAEQLGARGSEVTFTAGATEANNLAISGVMAAHPGANLVISAIEHDAVLAPAGNCQAQLAPVDGQGIVDLEALIELIDDQTVLVSVMYANNEVGTVQPVRELSQRLETIRRRRRQAGNELPLYLHSDAAQAANYLDLHVSRLGVDLLTINGGKIYGPKQSGALFVRSGTVLKPQIIGGGQEHGLRSGTENVAGSVGLAAALERAQRLRETEVNRLKQLQADFIDELTRALPTVVINGSRKKRLPNNVHVTFPGSDNERLLLELEQAGILAAAGSACSAGSDEPSHVLRAMGISEADARGSLRFSFGQPTTKRDIETTVRTLSRLLAE